MKRSSLMIAALSIAAIGCGKQGDAAPGPGAGGPQAIAVEVSSAFRDSVVEAITANGGIEAMQQIALRPDVDGRVVELLFREGQRVQQGTPLVRIDDAELKAQVDRAVADRDLARQALERTRQLVADRAAAPADLERAEAQHRVAEASLELLQVRLGRTVVRAPFAGVVGRRLVSVGDYVSSQRELLMLQTVSPVRVVFNVPERYAAALKVGQDVTFRVAALPGRDFTGRVDFVDPAVTLPARTITVKAVAGNGGGDLQPGMFVEVRLATELRANATVIPEEAVAPAAGGSFVWTVVDGKATRREVELGVRVPGFVEVRRGVETGENVVVGGLDRMFDGAPVNPTVVDRRPRGGREE
ncbi:MAG TPA: efflux RND transporter periplasmic adaptor subunit [Gemmatimonadales bacterium]|nr:efflux RND transporter periplasmic adaptor subunit [Gemmatimonadales bacterium]